MKYRCFLLICLLFAHVLGWSQPDPVRKAHDSLAVAFSLTHNDSLRVKILLSTGDLYEFENSDTALHYYAKAVAIAQDALEKTVAGGERISYEDLCGKCYLYSGIVLSRCDKLDSAIYSLKKAEHHFRESGNKIRLIDSKSEGGNVFYFKGDFAQAVSLYMQGLKIAEEIADSNRISKCVNNIGVMSIYMRNHPQAIKYLEQAKEIAIQMADTVGVAYALNNLGSIYFKDQKLDTALMYFKQAYKWNSYTNDKQGLARNLNNMGLINKNTGRYDAAIANFKEAIGFNEDIHDTQGLSSCYSNLGNLYYITGNHTLAVETLKKSLSYSESLGAKAEMKDALLNLAMNYAAMGMFEDAYQTQKKYGQIKDSIYNEKSNEKYQELEATYHNEKKQLQIEMLNKENELKNIEIEKKEIIIYVSGIGLGIFLVLSIVILYQYRQKRKANIILEKQKEEIEYKNNILENANEEILQQKEEILAQSELLLEINKQLEKLSIVASETDNLIILADKDAKIEWVNRAFTQNMGYTLHEYINEVGPDLYSVSANKEIETLIRECVQEKKSTTYTSLSNSRSGKEMWLQTTLTPILSDSGELKKLIAIDSDVTKLVLAEREITESIEYAAYIQQAVLPPESIIKQHFEEYALLFLPRNIVSGDFYWITELNNRVILAIADCTGHGVPGAFMSMLGMAFLNDIVVKDKVTEPGRILDMLRQNVIHALHQTGVEEEAKDGMVAGIVVLDKNTQVLQYGGSKSPLFQIKQGVLKEYKGDRMPISIQGKMDPYNTFEINHERGDVFYLFSDGYTDQFGGAKGEKFKSSGLKDLLVSISHENMKTQQDLLHQNLQNWMSGESDENAKPFEQLDDIMVFGFKL